jgi:phosphohistidine phosphatase SixA
VLHGATRARDARADRAGPSHERRSHGGRPLRRERGRIARAATERSGHGRVRDVDRHNPGLQDLALDLARPSPTARELATKYPTAALATLALQASSWQELDRDTAELVAFVRPRDLE